MADRVSNNPELTRFLEEKLAEKTSKEWEEIFKRAGVANGPIPYIDEVFQDPQVLHQEMLLEMNHPTIGRIKTIGFPTKLGRTPATLLLSSPLFGEHTEEVLNELGFRLNEIATMRKDGVI